MLIQTYEEESDTIVANYESSNSQPGLTPRCLYTKNKRTLLHAKLSQELKLTISNHVSDYLKVVFSSWKPLCSNMIIITSNPSYLELFGLFAVHTNVSTNARLSLQLRQDLELQVCSLFSTSTMTHYGLNDCTNLSNMIDIMNSLTSQTRQISKKLVKKGPRQCKGDSLWKLISPRTHASPPTLWIVLPTCLGLAQGQF